MIKEKFDYLLIAISQNLCTLIKDKMNISYDDARKLLYHSKLYCALEDEKTKTWYCSKEQLLEMFIKEQKTGLYAMDGDGYYD